MNLNLFYLIIITLFYKFWTCIKKAILTKGIAHIFSESSFKVIPVVSLVSKI